jgi:hypothetical protein
MACRSGFSAMVETMDLKKAGVGLFIYQIQNVDRKLCGYGVEVIYTGADRRTLR